MTFNGTFVVVESWRVPRVRRHPSVRAIAGS
jgi:hypothetical protein